MATWALRIVSSPEAAELADLVGIEADLSATAMFCRLLDQEYERDDPNSALIEALCCAVGVRYARCFTTSVRHQGRALALALIDDLPSHQQSLHEWLFQFRHKHLAHSVNAFEENQVRVEVREPPDEPAMGGIGTSHSRINSIGPRIAADCRMLCDDLRKTLRQVIKDKTASIQADLSKRPLREIYQLPRNTPFSADMSIVEERRPDSKSSHPQRDRRVDCTALAVPSSQIAHRHRPKRHGESDGQT